MDDILKIITGIRYINNIATTVYYIGTYQTDGWIYFNDDKFWRYNNEYQILQIFYISKEIWVDTNILEITNISNFNANKAQNISNGGGTTAPGGQGVEDAIRWAKAIAEDDSHGYDQVNRWGPDYDCSSLIYEAFRVGGGFDLPIHTGNTDTMVNDFTQVGFEWLSGIGNKASECQRGDILLYNVTLEDGHTELYLGAQQNLGAHINEFGGTRGGEEGDQTGNEISITGYYSNPWSGVLRYTGN